MLTIINVDATATSGPPEVLPKPTGLQSNLEHATGGAVVQKPATQVEDPSHVSVKPKLADFHIFRCLGEGAYGTVHLSQHKPSGLTVALKAISKVPRTDDNESRNLNTKALERRLKGIAGDYTRWVNEVSTTEIVALLRVAGERSLLQPFAFFHDLRYFYIATPFYSGGDLETIINNGFPLPVYVTRSLAADILIGLRALFKHGVVHHDIKPANILIGADNHAVLADFGLATVFAKGMIVGETKYHSREELDRMKRRGEKTYLRVGTDPYIAPEVWNRPGEHSYPADVWSFGVLVFEMLTGRLPWDIYLAKKSVQDRENGQDTVTLPDHLPDDKNDNEDREDEELVKLIQNAPIVLTDEEHGRLGIDAVTEDFYLKAMDRNPFTRPTPDRLMAHPFFTNVNFDWVNHSKGAVLSDWRSSVYEDSGTIPDTGGSLLNSTRPLLPNEDKLPHYSYLSPLLAAPRTTSIAASARSPEVPTGTVLDISPKAPHPICSGSGHTVVDPSLATTSSTPTLVGSPVSSNLKDTSLGPSGGAPLREEEELVTTKEKEESDCIPANSDDAPPLLVDTDVALDSATSLVARMFHKVKTWVWNVWEGVKCWAGWT